MKNTKQLFFLLLIGFPAAFLMVFAPINTTASQFNARASQLNTLADDGVANYTATQSITYNVEISWKLTHINSQAQDYTFKSLRLNDRAPDSVLTEFTPEYQECTLKSSTITGEDSKKVEHDEFENTFDIFEANLKAGEQITIKQEYEIILNEIVFDDDIKDSDIGDYDPTDEIHDLYCEPSEVYFEKSNADLIKTSNSIVNAEDNPIEKAEKIYNWIVAKLNYTVQDVEEGALWAYINEEGDCSEYSDLMVTLLRIQGIPARKITGFLISNEAELEAEIGEEYDFDFSYDGSTNTVTQETEFLGHAWIEYYVPSIGWIACDPTWGEESDDYFNQIDYIRFNTLVGAWFEAPGVPPPDNKVSEFPFWPLIISTNHIKAYSYDYDVNIEIIDTDFVEEESPLSRILEIPSFSMEILALTSIGAIMGLIVIHYRKSRKNNL